MPGFPSRGEQRKEPNSILICGLSASPVFSLRTFSTFSTESPEAQRPWNGHFWRQLGAFQPGRRGSSRAGKTFLRAFLSQARGYLLLRELC